MAIHPTAVIDATATIDPTADVGPYVVVQGPAVVGARTRLGPGVVVLGDTVLGADNVVHAGCVLGDEPQDLSYGGAPTRVRIGHRNVFREHVVVHRGTKADTETTIGDDGYLMSNAHVAHNCRLGSRVIMASGALLGGHVEVGDGAFVSGNCVVHQHVRVGRLSLMRGLSRASRDVPPFSLVDETHVVRGVNRIGLRRAGFDAQRLRAVINAFRALFRVRQNLREAMAQVEAGPCTPEVEELLAFIRGSTRGVAVGPPRFGGAGDAHDDD